MQIQRHAKSPYDPKAIKNHRFRGGKCWNSVLRNTKPSHRGKTEGKKVKQVCICVLHKEIVPDKKNLSNNRKAQDRSRALVFLGLCSSKFFWWLCFFSKEQKRKNFASRSPNRCALLPRSLVCFSVQPYKARQEKRTFLTRDCPKGQVFCTKAGRRDFVKVLLISRRLIN